MSKYFSIFRIRFMNGLQYRTAAWAGVATQFCWGMLEIKLFQAFYESNPGNYPMTFESLTSYIWLQQAFLSLYMLWFWENDLFDLIENGNISYELVRPISLYNYWFSRSLATRVAKAVLRCAPVLIVALLLPKPFGLMAPVSIQAFLVFVLTMILALFVVTSMNMIVYFLSFYTIHSFGIRMIFQTVGELLMGSVIPLPFFPKTIRTIVEFLPFASIQNIPFRIYTGDIQGEEILYRVGLQLFWVVALVCVGKALEKNVMSRIVVQGG